MRTISIDEDIYNDITDMAMRKGLSRARVLRMLLKGYFSPVQLKFEKGIDKG